MIGRCCFVSKIVEFCQMLYIRELYEMFIEPVLCSSNEDRQNCVGSV